jgi:transposase-like protein
MHDGMAVFRRRVERHFGGRVGRGARYPQELRAEAVSLARAAVEGGESLGSVAAELGVAAGTLTRWLEAPPASSWRAVEVVAEPEPLAECPAESSSRAGLVLITSRGHRLEGLSLDEATALLEALG